MSLRDVALSLGPVLFAAFEIPETIDFGGGQRLAVHDLPGGTRVIDLLGPVPSDIIWSGIFSGVDATSRARLLDRLRVQGQPLTLSWDVYSYSVVIRQLVVQYHNAAWVPYHIRVAVLQDNAVAIPPTAVALTTEAAADAAFAGSYGGSAGLDVSALQAAVTSPSATILGTAAYLGAQQALTGAQNSAATGFVAADGAIATYARTGVSDVAAVGTLVAAAATQASLHWAGLYLTRLQANLSRAGT